jgi:hypothetical protein
MLSFEQHAAMEEKFITYTF